MFFDQRGDLLERVRFGLQAVAYPLQLAVNSPSAAWRWTTEMFESRDALQVENAALRASRRLVDLQLLRLEALQRENQELRGLQAALPPLVSRSLVAAVINIEASSLRQRLVLNRGQIHGVYRGQTVIAGQGVLGQTLRVGPWSSEVILITDPESSLPVQVLRNGLRTLASGSGQSGVLTLPFLPIQADLEAGDLLVTSGLGGVFPNGLPVATVEAVDRDGNSPLARVRATPLASVDRDRIVMLIWPDPAHPSAPVVPPELPEAAP